MHQCKVGVDKDGVVSLGIVLVMSEGRGQMQRSFIASNDFPAAECSS